MPRLGSAGAAAPGGVQQIDIEQILGAPVGAGNPLQVFLNAISGFNLIDVNGVLQTGRDWSVDFSKLDVALSTRALEAGGNLAALVAGINLTSVSGAALGARNWSADLQRLTDCSLTVPWNLFKTQSEIEYAVSNALLFGAGRSVVAAAGNFGAIKLLNPAASGITVKLKSLAGFCSAVAPTWLFFDTAAGNLGAAVAGLNKLRGGAASLGTVATSVNAGALPAVAGAFAMFPLPAAGVNYVLEPAVIDAGHYITIWQGSTGVTWNMALEWEEF